MVEISDVRAAADRIAAFVRCTPVTTSRSIDVRVGARLHFKCENLQRGGAFKFRGATNAVRSLEPTVASRGVATHSSGNHGAALALAARERGIPAFVVVPQSAPRVKRAAIAAYGATIVDCEPLLADRIATVERVVAETGATLVPPYDDDRVIAGAGTAALELIDELDGALDAVWAPVGGGGLVSGTAIVVAALVPSAATVAAEPAAADDAARSLATGVIQPSEDPSTIADGLRTSLGERNFAVMRRHDVRVVTTSEEAIVAALRLIWERMKLVVEPSSAVPLAAMLEHPELVRGKRIGVILSGGNVDVATLAPHFG
jgi:threonine dehydratase/serine racemase